MFDFQNFFLVVILVLMKIEKYIKPFLIRNQLKIEYFEEHIRRFRFCQASFDENLDESLSCLARAWILNSVESPLIWKASEEVLHPEFLAQDGFEQQSGSSQSTSQSLSLSSPSLQFCSIFAPQLTPVVPGLHSHFQSLSLSTHLPKDFKISIHDAT